MEIYQPSEDSYLLSKSIKEYLKNIKNKKISILDMGSGSGIQAKTCIELGFKNILATDINKEALRQLKYQGFKAVNSNLFEKIKSKFDLIIFNPPYLPEDKDEPKDSKISTTAGKKGYELIIKFLEQAKTHLNREGKILLLFSSLSKPNVIKKQAKALGFSLKLISNQTLFFETLFVYEILIK